MVSSTPKNARVCSHNTVSQESGIFFLRSLLDSITDSCLGEHGEVQWHKLHAIPASIWLQDCSAAQLFPGNDSKRVSLSSLKVTLMNRKVCSLRRIIKTCTMTYQAVNGCLCLLSQIVTEEQRRQGSYHKKISPPQGSLRPQLHGPIGIAREDSQSSSHCQLRTPVTLTTRSVNKIMVPIWRREGLFTGFNFLSPFPSFVFVCKKHRRRHKDTLNTNKCSVIQAG